MIILPICINITLSFPKEAYCWHKSIYDSRKGKYSHISRTVSHTELQGLAKHDLAYLSDLLGPLSPETLSSSHTGFRHKPSMHGAVPRGQLSPRLSYSGMATLSHYFSLRCFAHIHTHKNVQLTVFIIELSKTTQPSFPFFSFFRF